MSRKELEDLWDEYSQKERWKWVPGYKGLYKVSTLGRIKGVTRTIDVKGTKRIVKGKLLSTTIYQGKEFAQLSENGITKQFAVHYLVLWAFTDSQADNRFAKHKNGNARDNRLCNLEYKNSHGWVPIGTIADGNHAYDDLKKERRMAEQISLENRE